MEIYPLQSCRPKVWNPGVRRALLPLKPLGRVLSISASCWWLPAVLWPSLAYRCIPLISALIFTWLSPCASVFFPLPKTPIIGFRGHPNLVWPHLILTNSICRDLSTFWGSMWPGIGERMLVSPLLLPLGGPTCRGTHVSPAVSENWRPGRWSRKWA